MERTSIIDAKIVKTMKSRNVCSHNELIEEVIKQCETMFKPELIMIKRRIEHLIERGFLERDKIDKRKYIYKP